MTIKQLPKALGPRAHVLLKYSLQIRRLFARKVRQFNEKVEVPSS